MSYYGPDPEQLRRMREMFAHVQKSFDTSAMRDLMKSVEQARKAFQGNPELAGLVKFTNDNQAALLQISKQFEQQRLVLGTPKFPTIQNFGIDMAALRAATASIQPITPMVVNAERLQRRIDSAPTVNAAEVAVDEEFATLDPVAAAELAAKLSATLTALFVLLDQIGYDTKAPAALFAFITALLWLYAHVEQYAQ